MDFLLQFILSKGSHVIANQWGAHSWFYGLLLIIVIYYSFVITPISLYTSGKILRIADLNKKRIFILTLFLLIVFIGNLLLPKFQAVATPSYVEPELNVEVLYDTHFLKNVQIALQFINGDRRNALDALNRDIEFNRYNLTIADNIFFQSISVSCLKRDYVLYSQLLDMNPSLQEKQSKEIYRLSVLKPQELNFENIFIREFKRESGLMRRVNLLPYDSRNPFWLRWLKFLVNKIAYKRNATTNLEYERYRKIVEFSKSPPSMLRDKKINTEDSINFAHVLYNGAGIVLCSNLHQYNKDLERQIYSLYNLDGLIRLVKIKQLIRENKISKQGIPAFLKQDSIEFKNPYANEPMLWDEKKEVLYFQDPQKDSKPIEIRVPFK